MPEVDNPTFTEVDLDKGFETDADVKSEEAKETNPDDQAVEFDINKLLLDMDAELGDKKPEKVEAKKEEVKEEVQEEVAENPQDEVEKLRAEVETLKSKYSASSKEGKKIPELEKRILELEPKVKVYDQIVSDPVLENMVVDYWKKGSQPSGDLKSELGLSEDFIFDSDDVGKPGTESQKFINALVEKQAARIVDQRFAELQKKNELSLKEKRIQSMKDDFIKEHGESEFEKLDDFMKSKQLTLGDMYKLMTIGDRDKAIARNAATQQSEQVKKNQSQEPSLANVKGAVVHETDERKVMDALKGIDGGDFSF